jgi:hypothetical protein
MGIRGAVGVLAADEVATDHAETEEDQQPGDGTVGEAGDVGHHRCDAGDRGEDSAEAEHRHRQREQHLGVLEGGQLVAQVDAFRPR